MLGWGTAREDPRVLSAFSFSRIDSAWPVNGLLVVGCGEEDLNLSQKTKFRGKTRFCCFSRE